MRYCYDKKRVDLKAKPPTPITYNVVNGVLTLCVQSALLSKVFAKVGYTSRLRAHERAEQFGL